MSKATPVSVAQVVSKAEKKGKLNPEALIRLPTSKEWVGLGKQLHENGSATLLNDHYYVSLAVLADSSLIDQKMEFSPKSAGVLVYFHCCDQDSSQLIKKYVFALFFSLSFPFFSSLFIFFPF